VPSGFLIELSLGDFGSSLAQMRPICYLERNELAVRILLNKAYRTGEATDWMGLGVKAFDGNRALEMTRKFVGYETSETPRKGAFSAATGSSNDNEFSRFHYEIDVV
jgi:hypothetical protein